MFVIMAAAMKADIKDALAKWLLVTLADYANDEGICWPSIDTLANVTGMGTGTVSRKLTILIDAGYVERHSHAFTSTRYKLLLPQSGACNAPEWGSNLSRTNNTPKKGKKMQVPDDWQPSDKLMNDINTLRANNSQEVIDHGFETDQFRDYHRSKGNTFASIDLAYRQWCRRVRGQPTIKGAGKTARGNVTSRSDKQSDRFSDYLNSIG